MTFSTTPVVCLTLAKWETVSGRFGGYLTWFTSDKTCRERHATPWFVERLGIDCDRVLRERLWKLYDEGFGHLRGGRGAFDHMKQLEHPDE